MKSFFQEYTAVPLWIVPGSTVAQTHALRWHVAERSVAEPGNELIVADYKSIESVILAWLADEPAELRQFRDSFSQVSATI